MWNQFYLFTYTHRIFNIHPWKLIWKPPKNKDLEDDDPFSKHVVLFRGVFYFIRPCGLPRVSTPHFPLAFEALWWYQLSCCQTSPGPMGSPRFFSEDRVPNREVFVARNCPGCRQQVVGSYGSVEDPWSWEEEIHSSCLEMEKRNLDPYLLAVGLLTTGVWINFFHCWVRCSQSIFEAWLKHADIWCVWATTAAYLDMTSANTWFFVWWEKLFPSLQDPHSCTTWHLKNLLTHCMK